MSRPRRVSEEPAAFRVTIHVTRTEKAAIEKAAKAAGYQKVSAYARDTLLDDVQDYDE